MRKSVTIIVMILVGVVLASAFAGAATAKKKPAVKQPSAQTIKWGKAQCDIADKALAKGDYEKARDIYSQVLWKLPASPRAKGGLKKAEAAIRGKQNKERQEALSAVKSGQAKANERLQTDKKLKEEAGITDRIVWESDLDQGMALAKQSRKPVMIDCTAAWCPWCVKLDKETWAHTQVIAAARSFVPIKIPDKDKTALEALGGVNSYPTIIFFDRNGTEAKRVSGFQTAQEILKEMNEVLRGGVAVGMPVVMGQ